MATDYLFVSMVFTFVAGFILMLLSFENTDDEEALLPAEVRNIAYNFLAAILFYFLGQQFLMAYGSTAAVLPFWMLSYGLAGINFTLFMIWVSSFFYVVWKRRKLEADGVEEE